MALRDINLLLFFILISWTGCILFVASDGNFGESLQPTQFLENFCKQYGYPFEVHYIHSYDGYILQIHRIPPKKVDSKKPEAVLVMHGLLSSSADWIVSGPNRSLAFLLHDEGYDVWLGNSRGNTFSRNHTTLSTADPAFWDFSWHEIGLNDAAATIDYIRNYTVQEKIFYIGYSQGTTQFWVLMSMKPEYNERIKFMAALAPVAFMGHVKGLPKILSSLVFRARDAYEETGYFEFLPLSNDLWKMLNVSCGIILTSSTAKPLCELLLVSIGGYSIDTDYKNIKKYLQFVPAGCSVKQMLHYAFGIQDPGHFRLYNYNYEKNMRLYNSSIPPEYPLHKITVPVGLYNTMNDILAPPEDVDLLWKKLPNVVEKYTVKVRQLNHLDFIWGLRMKSLIYDPVFKRMKEFSDTGNTQ